MGVTGLWKLIEPCGKPVPVETLEGKILAVDISIWLHQVVKGFQDNKGAALNNAHLLGLFHRLCKLMYYRVKPVFVFDGCVPQLKKDTIARRQQQRSKLNSEADRIQALLLQSLAKEKVVQQALGPNVELLLTSPVKKIAANKANRKDDAVDDMFKLPELPSTSKKNTCPTDDQTTDESLNENSFYSEDYTTAGSTDDSSFDESNQRNAYNSNLQTIDVRSKEFLQLPADVRHEILVDIKETRKQSSWGRLHELPSRSDDFSNFQMKRLLKRRDVQVSLEKAEQEMGGHTLTYAELTNIFNEEGILETDVVEKGTKQISSDEHTRFLLVKDLKKKLSKIKEEPIKKEIDDEFKIELNESSCSTSKKNDIPSPSNVTAENKQNNKKLEDEFEADLKLAIALSLEEGGQVYDEKDYEFDSGESLKLTKAQRQQLQNAAKGPARSYMIEYAGMNKEEVVGILEKTQTHEDFDNTIERLIDETEEEINKPKENETKQQVNSESQDIRLHVTDDSDSTDSDLEEVKYSSENEMSTEVIKTKITQKLSTSKELKDLNLDHKSDSDTDSELEEVKDSDYEELEANEVKKMEVLQTKLINKHNEIEDECVIEETPPLLPDEETIKTNNCNILNIQIDLSEPLKPEDDLFADIFDDKAKEEQTIEIKPVSLENNQEIIKNGSNTEEIPIKTSLRPGNMLSILDQLKQEAQEIKNIKLENIKLSESIVEISDDEAVLASSKVKNEVIEICDSDDNTKRSTTPPPQLSVNQSPRQKTKSPKLITPSKNHSITDFFDVNYVVKRTPDKPISTNEEAEVVPKVKSPFFVRKTPKSGRKSGSNSPSPNKISSKVNKSLFEQESEENAQNSNDGVTPLTEPKAVNEEDVLKEAANILKAQTTTEKLNTMAANLAKERQELENERNRQDRMGMSITQRMNSDCQKLLRLFGVPFIVAPMEAEAQCAFLDIVQLTNGTITDDSDIWLFGGRTVYKNFFAQNKHVMEFRAEQIQKDFKCDRKKLIQLACLVGSDYTTGIHGIGTVTALDILASFTPKEDIDKEENSIQNILGTLQKFRNWWLSFKSAVTPPGSSARLALHKKLKNIELHEGFPSTAVIEAYLTPKVDDNKEAFTWGYPDVESLREFTRTTFGWTSSKTDDILKPVLKKLNEKRTQQSIRNYFNVKNAVSLRQIKVSKRVQNAIDRMSGIVDSDNTPEKPVKAKRARKTVVAAKDKSKDEDKSSNEIILGAEATNSNQMARGPLMRAAKRVHIPETKQIIPQREKDLAQMEANKKLAAEILKNTSKETKKKRKA